MASRRLVLVLVLLFLPALMTIPGVVQPAAQMEVVASDVVDRDSLQAFVQRARAAVEDNVNLHDDAYAFADMEFRPMGEWNDGPIYIFFLTTEGVIHFHGASMSREGTDIYDEVDNNGVQFTKELVDAAAMGGDFVEYLFDNPGRDGRRGRRLAQGGLRGRADSSMTASSSSVPASIPRRRLRSRLRWPT